MLSWETIPGLGRLVSIRLGGEVDRSNGNATKGNAGNGRHLHATFPRFYCF
jgi:hypothetical protein